MSPSRTALAPCLAALALVSMAASAATIAVDTTADADVADASCTLREAIVAANDDVAWHGCAAGSGPDRIVFAFATAGPWTIQLSQPDPLPTVRGPVRIEGPGAGELTLDGMDAHPVLQFDTAENVGWFVVADLAVAHGRADDGAGVWVHPGETVRLERVELASNVAVWGGGGLLAGTGISEFVSAAPTEVELVDCHVHDNDALGVRGGGGVRVGQLVTLHAVGSTFAGNTASYDNGYGGGLYVQGGHAAVERSTFSGNAAGASGGGIALFTVDEGSLDLRDSTLTLNTADADASGAGGGGGLFVNDNASAPAVVVMQNTVVAGNFDTGGEAPDISLVMHTPQFSLTGWNLVGVNADAEEVFPAPASPGEANAALDWVGTAADPIDPLLEALADNGGATPTHRPIFDSGPPKVASPVIDRGHCPWAEQDQRGRGKPAPGARAYDHSGVADDPVSDDACDIGAVERGAFVKSAVDLFADGFEIGHTLEWGGEAP